MINKKRINPDYIFETSWEVCNKVGGIYTVLSTRAKTLQERYKDKIIFIGPDIWQEEQNPEFVESTTILKTWKKHACELEGLKVRVGRWNIPGKPIAILVDFKPYFTRKDELYAHMWEQFKVESMQAYGDYDESCIFAYATGLVMESLYNFNQLSGSNVIAHFNEWMLGMGVLYVQEKLPGVATIFTTHATSIGRSIAGNNKLLYAYFESYNGDQMAHELNMEAKHSVEKQAAIHADCFTTVSDITACECSQLLGKQPDVVTPNGFENNFVPKGTAYTKKRKEARKKLLKVVENLTGEQIDEDALMIALSGRYEYRNKGIDVFIESMNRIRHSSQQSKQVLAFILVPAWIKGPRVDLKSRLENEKVSGNPLENPYFTHELYDFDGDKVCNYLRHLDFLNQLSSPVKLIFVPSYLNGDDGIFDLSYYDLLPGMDLTIFPSYYEPWGYTPLESVAFSIPTITTNLAGFGIWAMKEGAVDNLSQGVEVLKRTDQNYFEISEKIKDVVIEYNDYSAEKRSEIRNMALHLSEKASWSHFIEYYLEAYSFALSKSIKRKKALKM